MERYKVDGNNSQRIAGQCVWRIMHGDTLIVSLYGPMSFIAANAACKALNDGSMGMAEAQAHYEIDGIRLPPTLDD